MAELRATPMVNPVMGLLADRLKKVQQFGAKPFGYENPPVEMLMNLLGVPAVQQTMERIAYGEPLTTGRGMTTKPRAEAVEAAMAVAPVAGLLGKATKGLPVGASIKNVAKVDELTGLPLNSDGTVTVYHHTNKKAADQITSSKKLKSAGEPDVYVTTEKEPNTGYGDTVVPVRINPEKLILDDEFPSGRMDFRIPSGKSGVPIKLEPKPSYPQQEALDTVQEGLLATQSEQPMQGLLQSKIPSPSSLTMPDVPTIEQMQKYGRVEIVPLSQAVSFQSARNWDKFNRGEHVGDLVQGFGDKPLALRLENGEYVIYDGNHRTDLAMQAGKTELPMNVIDVKSYDPAHAGRKPAPDRIDPDELLRSLLE